MAWAFVLMTLLMLNLALIFVVLRLARAANRSFEEFLVELPAVELGFGSLVLACVIALYQQRQLSMQHSTMQEVGLLTRHTLTQVKGFRSDGEIRERTETIFGDVEDAVNVFYPVEFRDKPLPYIAAGDFRALQIVSSFLGNHVHPVPVIARGPSPRIQSADVSVFLCTPWTNPALAQVFPAWREGEERHQDLPCWFEEPSRGEHRVIAAEDGIRLTSPADLRYELARGKDSSAILDAFSAPGTTTGLGIFGRISTKDFGRVFIIAGLHQYGTWLTAEFLNRLIRHELDGASLPSAILEEDDFLVVVKGQMETPSFDVSYVGVEAPCVWQRNLKHGWRRVF